MTADTTTPRLVLVSISTRDVDGQTLYVSSLLAHRVGTRLHSTRPYTTRGAALRAGRALLKKHPELMDALTAPPELLFADQ